MICPQCKKQIPDNSQICPLCSYKINHQVQLPKEIALRRYQRWFFYGLISFLFIGMILIIVKIYNVNSELVANMALSQKTLEQRKTELNETKEKLIGSDNKLSELEQKLKIAQDELVQKTEGYKEILFNKKKLEEQIAGEQNAKDDIARDKEECENKLKQTDSMVYSMIVSLGVGISNDNLNKILMADANLNGMDSDGDGLPDVVETALATDKTKADSDGDGFSDKDEVLGGFDPLGAGNLPIDNNFTNTQKGKILLQVEGNGEAWYVNPEDSKRYFLGRPSEALRLLADLK